MKIIREITFREDDRHISIYPYDGFRVSAEINFNHDSIKRQSYSVSVSSQKFIAEISRARTFGFLEDVKKLQQLKGVGNRTAQKIVATLEGKMDKFALIHSGTAMPQPVETDVAEQVLDVLVSQLGYRSGDAKQLVAAALERNDTISTPEELFEEVYSGEKIR